MCGLWRNIGSLPGSIAKIAALADCGVQYFLNNQTRSGDQISWISDVSEFMSHDPEWKCRRSLDDIPTVIIQAAVMRDRSTEK